LLDSISAAAHPQARTLTRIRLANYFAAALILPYEEFHQAAESFGYDVERLADHFAVGFETTAHQLSTLQRPAAPGVPFSFVRGDRAGEMSKRQSATGFHFSRGGGPCPLWTVYQAFSLPGTVHRQLAAMPDGRRYLWIARIVTHGRGRWGAPARRSRSGWAASSGTRTGSSTPPAASASRPSAASSGSPDTGMWDRPRIAQRSTSNTDDLSAWFRPVVANAPIAPGVSHVNANRRLPLSATGDAVARCSYVRSDFQPEISKREEVSQRTLSLN